MKRLLVDTLPTPEKPLLLPEDEAHHAAQVFRLRSGDEVELIDAKGMRVRAELDFQGKGKIQAIALDEPESVPALLSLPIRLEMAVLKGDAQEWTIEKAVELGVRDFQPVLSAHTVVQLDRKGPEAFRDRWQKIADQALKQCGRLDRMRVHVPRPLPESIMPAVGARFWLDESARATGKGLLEGLNHAVPQDLIRGVGLLIGPEGGWSDSERQFLHRQNLEGISLGPWVLRAETAAVYATSVLAASMR